jgi:hypothetical protein
MLRIKPNEVIANGLAKLEPLEGDHPADVMYQG